MVFPWFSYGFPMVLLWFSYGFPMVTILTNQLIFEHTQRHHCPQLEVALKRSYDITIGYTIATGRWNMLLSGLGTDAGRHICINMIMYVLYIHIDVNIYI